VTTEGEIRAELADLYARRHAPGGGWETIDDVAPQELVDIIYADADAIIEEVIRPLLVENENWIAISSAWQVYCRQGAGAFDWDYDSRDLMTRLTGYYPFMGPDADPIQLPVTMEPTEAQQLLADIVDTAATHRQHLAERSGLIACPTCSAPVDEWCTTASGERAPQLHKARLDAERHDD
jgi:hypothetical protein